MNIGNKLITLGKIIIWTAIIGSILFLFISCSLLLDSLRTMDLNDYEYSERNSIALISFSRIIGIVFTLSLGGITSGLLICGFGDFVQNIDKIRQTFEYRYK